MVNAINYRPKQVKFIDNSNKNKVKRLARILCEEWLKRNRSKLLVLAVVTTIYDFPTYATFKI